MPTGQPFLRRPQGLSYGFDIFLSSGSDIVAERDKFEHITATLNDQIYWTFWNAPPVFRLHVIRWEQSAPQKTDGDPNARFREQAERCQATVVLLHNDIRPGTKEELKAALGSADVQLSVIWMEPTRPNSKKTRELQAFLNSMKNEFIWEETGPPGSDTAWLSMFKVVNRIALEVFKDITQPDLPAGLHYEQV